MLNFKVNHEILSEMEKVWNLAEIISKSAKKVLGEDNPILESIEIACVHLMNACIEIEENLNQNSGNKIEKATLAQIIDVLTRIEWAGPKNRNELISAFQKAVAEVGKFNGVERNTIADACTRRLQLNRDGFLDLVESWIAGDYKALERILKSHCNIEIHQLIQDFFIKKGGFRENYQSR
jgi:hypothetical protein